MNEMFLVVISSTWDEYPVFLTTSEPSARSWAASCDAEKEASRIHEQRGRIASGDLLCIRIQRFVDGVSVSDEVARDLEAEDDDTEGGAS